MSSLLTLLCDVMPPSSPPGSSNLDGGSYSNSPHNSRDNLSQGGGGSSDGYGFYGSAATAAAASSVGSSLGGTAFLTSPSAPSEPQSRRAPFGWLKAAWTKSVLGGGREQHGDNTGGWGDHDGRSGGGGGAPPSLWHRSPEHGNEYVSSRSLEARLNEGGDGDQVNDGDDGTRRGFSWWWRGVVEGRGRQGGGGGGGGDGGGGGGGGGGGPATDHSCQVAGVGQPSLWKRSRPGPAGDGAGAGGGSGGGQSYLSFGELSRAPEVTYSLRGLEAGVDDRGGGQSGRGAKKREFSDMRGRGGGGGGVVGGGARARRSPWRRKGAGERGENLKAPDVFCVVFFLAYSCLKAKRSLLGRVRVCFFRHWHPPRYPAYE